MAVIVDWVASKLAELLLEPIVRQVGYVYVSSYTDNLNNLKNSAEQLHFIKEEVERGRDGKEIGYEVLSWLKQVEKILEYAFELFDRSGHANAAVSSPWSFPNLMLRYRLSRRARCLTYSIDELSSVIFDHVTKRHGSEELVSRKLMKEKIVSALTDPNVTKIGIHGLAGVGKTVLAQQVAQLVKGHMFEVVCMPTVTQTLDFERIQIEIADQLNKAGRIKEEENILIILDDVWQIIDLERLLGIPLGEHCKLLLISRNLNILRENETQQNFKLEVLDGAESWSLFQTGAGDDVLQDANLRNMAKQLAQRCAGLPIAILMMAASLRDKGVSYGKEALRILNENDYEKMDDSIYSSLERSYTQLEDEEVKQVFLLCGVHGPSILVSDLLKYVIGLGVFEHVISIHDARSKLLSILVDLEEASSLLLHSSAKEVNMHAFVCNVASLIASRHRNVFTSSASLKDWPGEDFLASCTQIILKRCNIQILPQRLGCPNLYFLYLDSPSDNHTWEIPDSFFEGMGNLQVLVLIGMTIPSLPSSIVSLSKLKTLCFNHCSLQGMVGIGALKSLAILSFFQSSMKELPSEIGRLADHLRMLDLSSSKIDAIPPKIISNLTKLEELYMGDMQKKHDVLPELMHLTSLITLELQIPEAWFSPCSAIFEKLERCNVVIGDKWEWSDSNVTSRLLKLKLDPNIHLEQEVKSIVKRVEELYLEETNGFSNVLYELNGEGFPQLKKLHIQDNTKIHHIVYSSERDQTHALFPNLETLVLDNVSNLEQICHGPLAINLFEKLKVIRVKNCDRLEYLFIVSIIKKFSQLVEIEVSACSSMKNVLLLDSDTTIDEIESIPVHSLTLQHLEGMTGFYSNSNVGAHDIPTLFPNAKVALPCLKQLELISVSAIKLLILWTPSVLGSQFDTLQHLETMEVVECKDLNNLFDIVGHDDKNDEELSGGLLPELRQLCLRNLASFTSIVGLNKCRRILEFKMLNHLTVCGCNKMKYILPLYVLNDLQQLKSIDIGDCKNLEQVFVDEQATKTTTKPDVKVVLPLLHSLKLSSLPEFASICSGVDHVICRSLTEMTVENCPKFMCTFVNYLKGIREQEPSKKKSKEMIVVLSKLENLNLRKVDHLKNMCKYPLVRLMHLTNLQLENCNKLEYVFSSSMAQQLFSLQELKIKSCERIEQIVKRETEQRANPNTVVEFPQVETLILDQLPKFTGSTSSQDGASVKWLVLSTVQVTECPNIKKSMLGTVDRSFLKHINVANCPPLEYEDSESKIAYLFDLTDELSKLEHLEIKDSKQLNKYMQTELQESSFTQLKTVEALHCNNELTKFLSSILLHRSYKLTQLKVESCERLEQVFDLTEFVAPEPRNLKFPNLNTMQLLCLPNLKCIWNKDPRGIVELGKIVRLEIIECGLSEGPLSTSLLEELVLLEVLKIESCEMIEQVVEDDTIMQERSFPNLKDLQLASLPNLTKFNSGHCNFIFPNLLSLRIEKCPKLNTFTIGFLSNQTLTLNAEGTSESDHVPLNRMMHACPELRTLKLAYLEFVEVDSLSRLEKLETLVIRNCRSLKRLVLPSIYFKLREVDISGCSNLEQISTDPKQVKTKDNTFRHLESIVLENLPAMHSFSCVETFEFPSLKELRIVKCPTLKILPWLYSVKAEDSSLDKHSRLVLFDNIKEGKTNIPPQLQLLELSDLPNMQLGSQEYQIPMFENLTSLKIIRCGSIERLFSISVAQHLSSLKLLTLYKCESMVQVLYQGGRETDKQVLVFKNLETIVLKHLPRLTSFCEEEDFDFAEFPELKMVRVENVPYMYTFVKKPLNTPKLKQVHLAFITECWLGGLNETITFLHEKQDELKDLVWESEQSSPSYHTNTAESSSQPHRVVPPQNLETMDIVESNDV